MRWRWKRTGAAMLSAPVSRWISTRWRGVWKPNADNRLDALHRGWRGALVTYIAIRWCNGFSTTVRAPTWSVGRGGQPEVDALARLTVSLPVRRLMLPELLKQRRGQHVRTRTVWR